MADRKEPVATDTVLSLSRSLYCSFSDCNGCSLSFSLCSSHTLLLFIRAKMMYPCIKLPATSFLKKYCEKWQNYSQKHIKTQEIVAQRCQIYLRLRAVLQAKKSLFALKKNIKCIKPMQSMCTRYFHFEDYTAFLEHYYF